MNTIFYSINTRKGVFIFIVLQGYFLLYIHPLQVEIGYR